VGGGFRYFVGAVAFGFAAVWIMATLAGALVCLSSAVVGYGVVLVAERMRARRASRASSGGISAPSAFAAPAQTPHVDDLALWADALRSDLGHVYEPAATASPLAREAVYGWPLIDETAVASEALQ
jgi:hypothetical protein